MKTPNTVAIEPLVSKDFSSIAELQPDGWGDITPKINFYLQSNYCFPIKAIVARKIVGIGAAIIHHDTAWLGHIIVHQQSRGRGIGKLITDKLVELAKSKNCETIQLIATDLGAPVYEKVGFQTETAYLFFKDVKIESHTDHFNHIRSYSKKDQDEISLMDTVNSGEERMCEIESHLQHGFVYQEHTAIEGFYLPTLGEGLIIATKPTAGIALLRFHLQHNTTVVLPQNNVSGISFLHANGFKVSERAKRMTFGKKKDVKLKNIYNRIGGNIG